MANEAKWASQDFEDIRIDLDSYEQRGLINVEDVDLRLVRNFCDKLKLGHKESIHDGEKETLAFLCGVSGDWRLCAADGAVFRVLGLLGKGEQGISLEEILKEIGLWQDMERHYTKRFREEHTRRGQIECVQDGGCA